MKIPKLALPLLLVLGGCASLTSTQIKAVNQFSRTSKNFSAYPSRVISGLAEIRVKRGIYYANTLDSPLLHLDELSELYDARKNDYKISARVDITFKVIDKYAQSLLLLSSDKYVTDLESQANNFGTDLDSLANRYNSLEGVKKVPTGFSGAVSGLIALGGKQYIRSKQAKEIKKFVPIADSLISVMTSNLLEFLESTDIKALIRNEEVEIDRNYLSFLQQARKRNREIMIENERDYLVLRSDIDVIKKLRDQTVAATKHLRRAHKKLLVELETKKDLKTTISELQDLYQDVKEINATMAAMQSSKNI